MPYDIGVNLFALTAGATCWDSPDVLATGHSLQFYANVQTTLAADYVGGSGVMQLARPNPFNAGIAHGAVVNATAYLNGATATPTLNFQAVGGLDYIHITSWNNPAQDVDYPAGTYINTNYTNGWYNYSNTPADWPVNPQVMDGARPTGYPRGLNNGQKFIVGTTGGYGMTQPGTYTILARGTGTVQVILYNDATNNMDATLNIGVVAGVPASTITVGPNHHIYQVWITASSTSDPLYNLRIIMPDRPGHADNFVGQYRAQANNPYFFLPHPDLVASLKPFAIVRLMQVMGTINNATVYTWAARPVWNGVGLNVSGITPYEYWAALINAAGCDAWVNIPTNAQPDYISSFASWLQANINAPQRVAVEWSNEVWNSSYSEYLQSSYEGIALYNAAVVPSITYSAATGTATVTMANHGFATGHPVQLCNAADDGFNGAYPITRIDNNTFSYVPAIAPASSPAVPILFHALMAVDTAWTFMRAVTSATWDGKNTITVVTAAAHGAQVKDIWQIANAVDPAFNGLWFAAAVPNSTQLTLQFTYGNCYSRPMPTTLLPNGGTITAKAGQSLTAYRISNGSGTVAGLPGSFQYQSLYMGNFKARIDTTFHGIFDAAGQASRLICCLMWQAPYTATSWNFTQTIDHYLAWLGGSFLPGCETAIGCAPYFPANNLTQATYLGNAQPLAAGHLTSSGGTATIFLAGHGYASGDRIQVANAAQVPYCGVVAITVVDPNHFTYPMAGTPASPATVANAVTVPGLPNLAIFACKDPPFQRELTAVSVSGTTMTCTSPGHGWASGLVVNLCPGTLGHSQFDPYPAIYGQFIITVTDINTFTVQIDPTGGAYTLPGNGNRMWAYDSSAIDVANAELMPLPVLRQNFAGVTWAQKTKYPTATIRCYEGGPNYFWYAARQYPAMWDLQACTENSPGFADVYEHWLDELHSPTYNAVQSMQYVHIQIWGSGFWGIKEWQHETNNPWWDMLMRVCSGTPDHTDDGVFPGFLPPPTGPPPGGPLEGSSILVAGLGGPLLATRGYGSAAAIPPPVGSLEGSSILLAGLGGPLLPTRGYASAAPTPPVTGQALVWADPDAGTLIIRIDVDPDAGSAVLPG